MWVYGVVCILRATLVNLSKTVALIFPQRNYETFVDKKSYLKAVWKAINANYDA